MSAALPPVVGNVPNLIALQPQWVGAKLPGKEPVNPHTGALADVSDPSTWAGFIDAFNGIMDGRWPAMGYVFAGDVAGVDLDDCRDPDTGQLTDFAREIVGALASYTEISASGRGLHIFVRGALPRAYKRPDLEIYSRKRYFLTTGDHLPGTPETVEPRQAELEVLAERHFPARTAPASPPDDRIPEGSRHTTLLKVLGAARRQGTSEAGLQALADAENARCTPAPLPAAEIARLVRSVLHYTPEPTVGVEDVILPTKPAPAPIRFCTAADLARDTPEQPDWIAPPFLARGCLTELDARPKKGKTTFTLAGLVRSILLRLLFLRQPTVYVPVVYLTEERRPTFRAALDRAGLLAREDLTLLSFYETAGLPWPAVVDLARAECQRTGAGLLVVDTLSKWARLKDDSENQAGTAEAALEPLQQLAHDLHVAILVARHERKSGGDVGDSARGSNAFTGGVDVVLQLTVPKGQQRPTVRLLNAVARFDDTPPSLLIERTPNAASLVNGFQAETFTVLGTEGGVAAAEAAAALDADLPTAEAAAISLDDFLAAHPTLSRSVVQDAITRDPLIQKTGKGRKGSPQRYFRPLIILPESQYTGRQKGSIPEDTL